MQTLQDTLPASSNYQLRTDTNRAALRVLEDWRCSYEGLRTLELGAGAGMTSHELSFFVTLGRLVTWKDMCYSFYLVGS